MTFDYFRQSNNHPFLTEYHLTLLFAMQSLLGIYIYCSDFAYFFLMYGKVEKKRNNALPVPVFLLFSGRLSF